jgi:hypothetical protein
LATATEGDSALGEIYGPMCSRVQLTFYGSERVCVKQWCSLRETIINHHHHHHHHQFTVLRAPENFNLLGFYEFSLD